MSEDEKSGGSFPFRNRTEDGDVWRGAAEAGLEGKKRKKGKRAKKGESKKRRDGGKAFFRVGEKGWDLGMGRMPDQVSLSLLPEQKVPDRTFHYSSLIGKSEVHIMF